MREREMHIEESKFMPWLSYVLTTDNSLTQNGIWGKVGKEV